MDEITDDGEARNDFWSIDGNYIYRHHVEPRVQLFVPKEETFAIPLRHIDVDDINDQNLGQTLKIQWFLLNEICTVIPLAGLVWERQVEEA